MSSPTENTTPLINLRDDATVLSPDRRRVLTFDREGRLLTYFKKGRTILRSLRGELHLRWGARPRHHARIESEQALEVFREAYGLAREQSALAPQRIEEEILPWTPERLMAERERFDAVYRPIAILPPDQYRAIVLQATEGCTWNRCTFCSWYQDRPFRARASEEFRHHAAGVKALLGKGMLLRKGIFLADGNALALSLGRLEPLFEVAREHFPGRPLFGFVDLFSGERRPSGHWERLRGLGLERVYIGVESGLGELLALVNKPGSAGELIAFVEGLKGAGLAVGLILLVGLGGERHREAHARASLELLEELPLDGGDLVYLSPFIEHPESEYARRREELATRPLDPEETEAELQRLASSARAMGLRAARYDIRNFIY